MESKKLILEDWEYTSEYMFAVERQKDIENSWREWEEKEYRKNKLPAIIKIINNNDIPKISRNNKARV